MWKWSGAVTLFVLLLDPCYVAGRSHLARSSFRHKHSSYRSSGSFHQEDEIHHYKIYKYGTDVPGLSLWPLAVVHRRLLDDDDEDNMQTLPPPANAPLDDSSPTEAAGPESEERREKKNKIPEEVIAGGVFGLFFVTAFLVLVIYVCKTRKYIEQRREASLARARSLDFALAAEASASVSPSVSASPSSLRGESSYIPPAEWALYPQASRGSSATLE